MSALLDLGVDGIMTDEAGTLRDLLVARAAWPTPGPPAGPTNGGPTPGGPTGEPDRPS
jgi:hypothetical protein